MNITRYLKFSLLQLIAVIVCVSASDSPIIAQSRSANFDRFFAALAEHQNFNGSVLVAEKGKVVYQKSFGYADISNKRRNTENTVFPIASVSKTFTAVAILQQIEKGSLSLDDPAAKYLTDFPYPKITVRHLLSHTSGLPPYDRYFSSLRESNPDRVFTNTDFLPTLFDNKKPLIYEPGDKWNYDNINYIVLALLLEKVSGESYEQYIEEHIHKPAGMTQTRFSTHSFDSIPNIAVSHIYPHMYDLTPVTANSVPYISKYWKAYQFKGFSQYASTMSDLLKYDQALSSGSLVGKAFLDQAYVPVKLNNGDDNPGNYGLGWSVAKNDSFGKAVFHIGGATGLSCVLYRNITKGQTVIAYDISRPSANYIAVNSARILNGQKAAQPKKDLANIFGRLLVQKGEAHAFREVKGLVRNAETYQLDKDNLIRLGYEFLGDIDPYRIGIKPNSQKALAVFKLCVSLFPDYWNSYDSYGDALARAGQRDWAIKMYRRSLELKPDSESGKMALQKLLSEKKS